MDARYEIERVDEWCWGASTSFRIACLIQQQDVYHWIMHVTNKCCMKYSMLSSRYSLFFSYRMKWSTFNKMVLLLTLYLPVGMHGFLRFFFSCVCSRFIQCFFFCFRFVLAQFSTLFVVLIVWAFKKSIEFSGAWQMCLTLAEHNVCDGKLKKSYIHKIVIIHLECLFLRQSFPTFFS